MAEKRSVLGPWGLLKDGWFKGDLGRSREIIPMGRAYEFPGQIFIRGRTRNVRNSP